jgi:2-oxoacid:acceptor oxidoreductase gamma subunit (pyruvate/2-ketoisovalerate family)
MAVKMLASMASAEGKHVASFPMYGFERRGAPVVAFSRIDDKPLREKTQIYEPDCLVVIDPTLLRLPTLYDGIKDGGVLIVNTHQKFDEQPAPNVTTVGAVNATQIGLDEIGRDIPNTCLIGALAATTGWLKLESILKALPEYFSGKILEMNNRTVERGYNEVEVHKW